MTSNDQGPPSCCGLPIPGTLVERVMNREEQHRLMNKMVAWDNDDISESSSPCTNSTDLATVNEDERNPRLSEHSFTDVVDVFAIEMARQNLERAMNFADFRDMRIEQESQRDRCVELDRLTRQSLSEDCEARKDELVRIHEQQVQDMEEKVRVKYMENQVCGISIDAEQHSQNISQVEDKHVQDEMDLRKSQSTESRNTATALRHMEAFCRGQTTSGEPHHRRITEQDRGELAKTKRSAMQMDKRHESEVSVLRGEQSRRMSQRVRRQDVELQQLEQRQIKELEDIDEQYESALRELEDETEKMRERLYDWWQLQVEICRRTLENETGILIEGALPAITWPDEDYRGYVERRDTLNESPHTRPGANGVRKGSSPRPPAAATGKDMGISTTFALRSSAVGQA